LEEPLVLPACVALLQQLLDVLLGIFPLRWLLEAVVGDGTLKALEFQCVTCGEKVGVVDDLEKSRKAQHPRIST
jgi:hypothetical protein